MKGRKRIIKYEHKLLEQLSDKKVVELVAELVKKVREHPEVKRGASVRAGLAIIEIVQGYRCIRGIQSRNEIKAAAMLSLPERIIVKPESIKKPQEIILEIVQEVIFGIQSLEYGDPFKEKKKKPSEAEEDIAEFTKELMDFQDQQYRGTTRMKNLHAEFVRKKREGENVDPDNLDYNLLEKKMYDLGEKGIVKLDEIGDGYKLQSSAIIFLLKNILKKDFLKTGKCTKKEQITEKSYIRKYMTGDTYRTVSPRHTLRRLVRKGKHIDEISFADIRSFEKVSILSKDIALCIDVSESMRERQKLFYAKLAAAGVAKTASANKDQVCIVAFSNTAEAVCPLSGDLHKISRALLGIQTGKYTNAGGGIKMARTLLQKGKASNRKQMIIISDGLPNIASEEDLYCRTSAEEMNNFSLSMETQSGNQHFHYETKIEMQSMFRNIKASSVAYKEVKKSRMKDIEISFLYIGDKNEHGIIFAKKVARLGKGSFYHVKDIPELPKKALLMM